MPPPAWASTPQTPSPPVVVFLVALPLCLGIALASGPALGLVTGIVGGLLVGAIQGTPFSVSGPACRP